MYNAALENKLVVKDVVEAMVAYTSIQPDKDEDSLKAAQLVAQKIDVAKKIGNDNLQRCIDQATDADKELRELVVPALMYFTYYRSLKMFQGTLADGGFSTDTDAESIEVAKGVANQYYAIGSEFISEAVEFLEAEDPQTEATNENPMPMVRVFGGQENRASN